MNSGTHNNVQCSNINNTRTSSQMSSNASSIKILTDISRRNFAIPAHIVGTLFGFALDIKKHNAENETKQSIIT